MEPRLAFWAIAAAMALASLALTFAPLLRARGRGERRASYDARVYRDQLAEIEADLARGVLSPGEAEATRAEVARRLLAAADAEAAEPGPGAAPPRLSRLAAAAMLAALVAAAGGLYAWIGAPGLPDRPLAAERARTAAAWAARPGQAELEAAAPAAPAAGSSEDAALVARLEAVLRTRPNDVEGHRLLARSLGALGRWREARAAQARVVKLRGAAAEAQDLIELAELMVLAAGGYVSPEAEAALERALALEPAHPVGRYFSGLALAQGGRPDRAYRLWAALLAEGPPDAPWIAPIERQIAAVAREANLPPPGPARGPTAADPDAAADAAPAERQAMIEGMVEGLAQRLADQGGTPEEWARLIRSLGVLGRAEAAGAAWAEAQAAYTGDPAALATLAAAAREAGLAP